MAATTRTLWYKIDENLCNQYSVPRVSHLNANSGTEWLCIKPCVIRLIWKLCSNQPNANMVIYIKLPHLIQYVFQYCEILKLSLSSIWTANGVNTPKAWPLNFQPGVLIEAHELNDVVFSIRNVLYWMFGAWTVYMVHYELFMYAYSQRPLHTANELELTQLFMEINWILWI